MQKPIVVVQLGVSYGGFNFEKQIWGYMEWWVNEMMLPFIEASRDIDMADDAIAIFEKLDD